jgi:hypothetical protein
MLPSCGARSQRTKPDDGFVNDLNHEPVPHPHAAEPPRIVVAEVVVTPTSQPWPTVLDGIAGPLGEALAANARLAADAPPAANTPPAGTAPSSARRLPAVARTRVNRSDLLDLSISPPSCELDQRRDDRDAGHLLSTVNSGDSPYGFDVLSSPACTMHQLARLCVMERP